MKQLSFPTPLCGVQKPAYLAARNIAPSGRKHLMRKALIIALSSLALGIAGVATVASAQDAPAAAPAGQPTADWTIGDLIANPGALGVLKADLPQLLAYDGLDQIKGMSLRQVSQMAPDKLPSTTVDKVDTDLKALPASK
jgi:hypothetical protein